MKIPLPSSIKGLVALIVLMALFPAVGFIIYSGMVKIRTDIEVSGAAAMRSAKGVILEQTQALENARILLYSLAQLDDVRRKRVRGSEIAFRSFIEQTPFFSNIRLMDLEGNVLATGDPAAGELSAQAKAAYMRGLGRPGFMVNEIPAASGQDKAQLNCQYPVMSGRSTAGFLLASLTLGISEETADDLKNKLVDRLFIANRDGAIIFSYSDGKANWGTLEQFSPSTWQMLSSAGSDGGFFKSADGKYVVYEKMPESRFMPSGLVLVLTISDETLFRHLAYEVCISLLVLAGVLALAMFVTLKLCNASLLTPVRLLLGTANKLKEGMLDTRLGDVPMPQELKVLAESMDTMAESIETRDQELIKARDAANAGTQAKTDFLANMSHEIRTPMNAILGMTYLTRQGTLTDQQRMYMDTIHSEADKLLVIINDILDFSKIEAGKFTVERLAFKLPPLLDIIVDNAREEARKKGLAFTYSQPPDLPEYVFGDPHHCKQILGNVLGNVIRLTAAGGISFTLSREDASTETQKIVFTISRSGGTHERDLAELLDEGDEEKDTGGGINLNLAVTQKLIPLLGGDIAAIAGEEGGNVLRVRLPLAPATAEDVQDTPGAGPEAAPQTRAPGMDETDDTGITGEPGEPGGPDGKEEEKAGPPLRGIRILLAEDNPINQQIAEELLTGSGAEVRTASDGVQALALLGDAPDSQPFDIVLMDIQMPKLDGLAATRRIRLDKRYADIPVIAMTAHSQDEQWQECREAGMNDFIPKPLDVPRLLSVISRWSGSRKRPSGA